MISNMEITIVPSRVETLSENSFKIYTCNTQYLDINSTIEGYTILAIENNESITLQGTPIISSPFNLRNPLFIPETPQGANNEIVSRKTDLERHPFIWLLENFPTDYSRDTRSQTVGTSRVRLFFLNASLDVSWTEDEHRKHCIEPMANLCEAFIKELEFKISGKINDFTITNRIRFGKADGKKKILDEDLSGVELDISIPIRKWAVECTNC